MRLTEVTEQLIVDILIVVSNIFMMQTKQTNVVKKCADSYSKPRIEYFFTYRKIYLYNRLQVGATAGVHKGPERCMCPSRPDESFGDIKRSHYLGGIFEG